MQSNAEKLKPKPKGQCKSNKKNVRSYGGGGRNGANSSTGDFQGHTSSPSTWPRPFMSYRAPLVPITLIQPPLNISHNVYNPRVPVFQSHFGIPMSPQPVPATMTILPPITPILNQPRPGLYFNDWSTPPPPMRSKPRFAPIIPPSSAPKINSKMHWERETPHAIAIMDPESRKDIRKEYIENIRKCSSLREASEAATESTAEADSLVEVTVFPVEEIVGVQDLQFLQDSIISNEECCITQGELQHIVEEEQVSVIEEPSDQIDKESEENCTPRSGTLSEVPTLNEEVGSEMTNDEELRMETDKATENSGDTLKDECEDTIAANEDDLEVDGDSEDCTIEEKHCIDGEIEEKVCESCIENEELPIETKCRKRYTLEYMYKFKHCQTEGSHIKDLNKCPEVIRDIDVKRTVIVNKLFPHYALKDTENVIITTRTKRTQQATDVSQSTPKRSAKSAVKAKSGIIHMNLSIHEDVRLNEVENAWKPSVLTKQTADCGEGVATENLLKQFRGILNKITPKNFDVLLMQVKELKIITRDQLNGVIDLVFEKAVAEPNFKECYTKLCQQVSQMSGAAAPKKATENNLDFRRCLIERVQREFDTCVAMSKKNPNDFDSETDYDVTRKRAIGSVQFVGELFNFHLLSLNIMKGCAKKLLNCATLMSVELICKLIATIGRHMESVEKNSTTSFIQRVKELVMSKKNKFPSRIRFMVMDLADLRKTWNKV